MKKIKKNAKDQSFFFQPDSKAGSHGLLTYASTSCYGGKKTLTTPCPKVSKHENYEDFEEEKGLNIACRDLVLTTSSSDIAASSRT